MADAALELAARSTQLAGDRASCVMLTAWCAGVRDHEPVVSTGDFDITVEDMKVTVEQFYRRSMRQNGAAVNVALESDLADFFVAAGPPPARASGRRRRCIEEHRALLTDKITYWTGVKRPVVRALVERMVAHVPRAAALQREIGREHRIPGRADGLRHDAGDELPDARQVRSTADVHGRPRADAGLGTRDGEDRHGQAAHRRAVRLLVGRGRGARRRDGAPEAQGPRRGRPGGLRGARRRRPQSGLPAPRRHAAEPRSSSPSPRPT